MQQHTSLKLNLQAVKFSDSKRFKAPLTVLSSKSGDRERGGVGVFVEVGWSGQQDGSRETN